jgi:signal peptidase I
VSEQAAPEARSRRANASAGGGLWEQVGTLLLAVLIALGIRSFVIEPFRIPSGSMYPTLLIGDHLFVNKFLYGIKIPFTDIRLPGLREPQRGDVIVFSVAKRAGETFPADKRPELPREEFVKRIIGLPGDRIEVRDRAVHVNGKPLEMRETGESFRGDPGQRLRVYQVSHDSRSYRVLADLERYFMLGDNRDHSKDSRIWGTVRLAEIKGPAFLLYWSWDFNGSWERLLNPKTWWVLLTQKMRWERIGDRIE